MSLMKRALATSCLALGLCLPAIADTVIDVAAPFEIQSAEPSTSGFIFTRMGIAETLVDADPQGRLLPGLATEWAVSADGLTWRFVLRQGVRFHDGSPMTAEAVVNALEIARAKPGPVGGLPIASITAEDGAIAIILTEPRAALPAFLAESRAQILAPAAYGADGQAVAVIGTGPYRVTELTPPLSLRATAFADYWGNAPQVPDVTYAAVGRAETRALMAESGDADFVFNLDPASVTRLSQSDAVEVLSVAIPRTLLLKVNAAHPRVQAKVAAHLETGRQTAISLIRRMPHLVQGLAEVLIREGEISGAALEGWTHTIRTFDPEVTDQPSARIVVFPGRRSILRNDEAVPPQPSA